jgi:hypothetical protein
MATKRTTKKTTPTTEVIPEAKPKVATYKLTPASDGFMLVPGAPQVWIDKAGVRQKSYIYEQVGNFKHNTGVVKTSAKFQLFFRNSIGDLILVSVNHLAEGKDAKSTWSPAKMFVQDLLSQYRLIYEGTEDIKELTAAFKSIKELNKPFVFTKTLSEGGYAYYTPVRVPTLPKTNDDLNFVC